jgi:hypothetical protein
MSDKATILKLLLRLKETQCELLAAKCNRDEWKKEAQRLRAIANNVEAR